MIVVDTNILVYLYLPCEKTREVKALLEKDPVWAAPVLWRSELLNVLCRYMRLKGLHLSCSLETFELAEELLGARTYTPCALKVLEVARRTGCSGSDSEFVALAEDLQTRLITYDDKLLSRAAAVACPPAEVKVH